MCVITLFNLTSSFLNPNYFNTSVNVYSRVESYVSGYLSHCSVRARTVGDTTHPSPVRGQTVQLFQRLERVVDIVLPLYGAMTKYASTTRTSRRCGLAVVRHYDGLRGNY